MFVKLVVILKVPRSHPLATRQHKTTSWPVAIVLPDLPGNQCRTCAWYALVFPSIEVVPWPEWPSCYSVLRPPPWSESWEQLSLDDSSTFHETNMNTQYEQEEYGHTWIYQKIWIELNWYEQEEEHTTDCISVPCIFHFTPHDAEGFSIFRGNTYNTRIIHI